MRRFAALALVLALTPLAASAISRAVPPARSAPPSAVASAVEGFHLDLLGVDGEQARVRVTLAPHAPGSPAPRPPRLRRDLRRRGGHPPHRPRRAGRHRRGRRSPPHPPRPAAPPPQPDRRRGHRERRAAHHAARLLRRTGRVVPLHGPSGVRRRAAGAAAARGPRPRRRHVVGRTSAPSATGAPIRAVAVEPARWLRPRQRLPLTSILGASAPLRSAVGVPSLSGLWPGCARHASREPGALGRPRATIPA